MPVIEIIKQSFKDPLTPQLYGDIVVVETEFGSIGGVGVPEDYANVTGDHIFLDPSQPADAKEGDIWYDSNDDNHPYKLVNDVWTSIRDIGAAAGIDIGQWVNNLIFSAIDYRVVAWGAGSIKLQDGTTYAISAGNTGNMAAVTYIFLDISVSLTVLQTTTTATSAVGANRILVAVAKQNSDTAKDAEFQVFGGYGQSTFITADNIAANTITGNEIVGNTITANKLSVTTLSSITADMGTLTAGTITGATFQTSTVASTGIKFDSTSLRGYNGAATITFQLDPATGVLTASAVILTGLQAGSDVNGAYLTANSVASAAANLALRGWTQTSAFTVTDADTIAWGSGTFTASDGTSYSIGASNTGNMAAKTYVYLDIAVSTTAYQVTTTATTAVGNGKVLIAICQNATGEATFMLLNNNSYNIDAANIVAGSITANEIAATTITAGKLSVSTLSSITADLGTITAGTITGGTFQTSASATVGIKFDSTSLRGYNASNTITFQLDPSTGTLTISKVVLTGLQAGSDIDGSYLAASSVASASVNIAMRGWEQTCAFSVTDADTVAWGAGTFTASDGTAYSIGANNTGNMTTKTYIYLDILTSTTEYQVTTTATTAVGNGKVLIAIAQNTVTFAEATFMLLNDNSYNINATNIIAGSITANEIAATTITAAKMNVTQLSAIAADLGTITAGTITVVNGGNTITLAPASSNAIFSGPTGSPTLIITQSGGLTATSATISGAVTSQITVTTGEAVTAGDNLCFTSANTVKRFSPLVLPTIDSADQSATLTTTASYDTLIENGILIQLSTSLYGFLYFDSDGGIRDEKLIRFPITPSTGAVGTISKGSGTGINGTGNPRTLDMVSAGLNKLLLVASKANNIRCVVVDMTSSISSGTQVSVDTTNCERGYGDYISDSHVLILYKDTSTLDIVFSKKTLSGTTLSASSSGTVTTPTGTFDFLGVRRFLNTDYFLLCVQNSTDGSAEVAIATYDEGSSTFTATSAWVNFTGSIDLKDQSVTNSSVAFVQLSSTEMMLAFATSTTNVDIMLVTRSGTTPSCSVVVAVTRGDSSGFSLSKVNARCALLTTFNGTTETWGLYEVDAAGTGITTRVTSSTTAVASNSIGAAFQVNPTRMGFLDFIAGNDVKVYTAPVTLPAPAKVAKTSVATSSSLTAIISGSASSGLSLTVNQKYFADWGGLLTTDGNGTPDKVGSSQDTDELIVMTW